MKIIETDNKFRNILVIKMAKKNSKKRLIILLIVFLIAVVSIVLLTINRGEKSIKVSVETVGKRTITQTVTAIGKIQPEMQVKISSQTSGEVIFLAVKEGDTVSNGQVLVRIKPDIIETQLDQYKAALEGSKMDIDIRKADMNRQKSTLKRITELYEKEFVSQDEFERTKTAYEQSVMGYNAALSRYAQSEASLKQIQRSAERTIVYSPLNGIVTQLNIENGEKVLGTEMMEGTAMMIVSDLSIMNAEVEVDENDIILVKIGDKAKIEIDAFPDKIFDGYVIEIGHSAISNKLGTQDQVTNFKVKIRMFAPENKLRPGMSCSVDILTETRKDIIAVPLQAVTIRETNLNTKPDVEEDETEEIDTKKDKAKRPNSVVFLQNKNKAKKVTVETGISDNGYIEITKGLKLGDKVIKGSFMAVSKELDDGLLIQIDSTKKSNKNKK
jgi:HlyD family secretion protein